MSAVTGVRDLSDRERQVLSGVADGFSTDDMAVLLGLSSDSVKTYLSRVYRKLGARDASNAVALGFRQGLLR